VPSGYFLPSRLRTWVLIYFALTCLVSCGGRQARFIALPDTPPVTGGLGWLVVKDSYARLKLEPRRDAPDAAHLRNGAMTAILGRDYGEGRSPGTRSLWYRIAMPEGSGWILSDDVELYESKAQALHSLTKEPGK
jgi:hypothetical protein